MARKPRFTKKDQEFAAQVLARALATRSGRIALVIILITAAIAYAAYYLYQHRGLGPKLPPNANTTQPATTAPGQVRVATWNLMKFSERDKAGQHPPDLVAIAKIIKDENFDVVAIQEVQQTGAMAQRLRRQLNEPWRIEITDPTGRETKERYAFLYRADRVELLGTPQLIPGPEAQNFDRVPAMASFRAGQFDFTLVTTHLWYGAKANNPQRRQEAAALARFAKALADAGPERDVLVLGDFNEMRSSGNNPTFAQFGLTPLNRQPTNLGSNEVYDNILINPAYTKEFTGNVGVTPFDQTLYNVDDALARQSISDHRPVHADFTTTGPDDD